MRSYRQYCAVAKALDVIGDRWTMLIVRELLLAGPSRYTDLREGLPGIATNLLADRLREMVEAGLLRREQAPPPIAATLFSLTERGESLRPVLNELGLWGIPYMAEGPAEGDEFRSRWLSWPVELFLADSRPDLDAATLELRAEDGSLAVDVAGGEVATRPGPVEGADAVLSGPPHAMLAVLSGHLALGEASSRGVRLEGDARVLARLVPAASRSHAAPGGTARAGRL